MSKQNFQPKRAESAKPLTQRAGDSVERVGDKLAQDSHSNAGKPVRNASDKIGHMGDKRRS